MTVVFDIETIAYPDEDLGEFFQSKMGPAPAPIPFDPSEVKHGRTKDVRLIAEQKETARLKHEKNQVKAADDYQVASIAEFLKFKEEAALSPVTSNLACIAYYSIDKDKSKVDDGSEREVIERFWKLVEKKRKAHQKLIGLNIFDFDLPYLRQRSWILKIPMPDWIMSGARYWDPCFIDLRKEWLCGRFGGSGITAKSNFDWIARAMGTAGKPEGINGADFGRLWKEDRETAIKYAENDVIQPAEWAKRMGVA